MLTLKIIGTVLCALYILALSFFAIKSRKPFRFILYNAVLGVFFLILTTLLGGFFGISLNINIYTLLLSCFWGIPGDIIMILTDLLFA